MSSISEVVKSHLPITSARDRLSTIFRHLSVQDTKVDNLKEAIPDLDSQGVDAIDNQVLVKENDDKITALRLSAFKPLTPEQIELMDIQSICEYISETCFALQNDKRKTRVEYLRTLQSALNILVEKLSVEQKNPNWSVPKGASIISSGLEMIAGGYAPAFRAASGSLDMASQLVQQYNSSTQTLLGAVDSQIRSTLQALRDSGQLEGNEYDKALGQLEDTLRKAHQLLSEMAGR